MSGPRELRPDYVASAWTAWAERHPGYDSVDAAVLAGVEHALRDWCDLLGERRHQFLTDDYEADIRRLGVGQRQALLALLRAAPLSIAQLTARLEFPGYKILATLTYLERAGFVQRGWFLGTDVIAWWHHALAPEGVEHAGALQERGHGVGLRVRRGLLRMLRATPELGAVQMAARLAVRPKTVWQGLRHLRELGLIRSTGNGRYALEDGGF